jgi:hypothetical protein
MESPRQEFNRSKHSRHSSNNTKEEETKEEIFVQKDQNSSFG